MGRVAAHDVDASRKALLRSPQRIRRSGPCIPLRLCDSASEHEARGVHLARWRLGAVRSRSGGRLWRELEAATERKVEIHALHALLGLHVDQRGSRGVQRKLPLLDEPEIGAPDLELGLHHRERLLIVGERLRQDFLPLARGDLGCQCAFHFAERAQSYRGVLGDGLFLLSRPNLRPAS